MKILLIILLFATAIAIPLYLYFYETRRYDFSDESALDGPVTFEKLRNDPEELAKLAGKVSSVDVVHQEVSGSRSQEEYTLYEAFIVDVSGVPNTFAYSRDHDAIAAQAKWVAAQLDVPLSNNTH